MTRCTQLFSLVLATTLLAPIGADASQVRLDVSLAHPTLLANKKQTTFVKVGLTGFKLAREADRTPVNVAIVLDKSGSMSGQKIAKAKQAAISAIDRLNANDIVSIVTYDSTVNVLVPATKLTDKRQIRRMIDSIESGGQTALFAGVSKGVAELRKFLSKNRVNRVILLSDGLANVGPQSPRELGALGASLIKEGISVSTMGLGLDYNEDLMMELARKSDGNHIFIERSGDLVRIFNYEFNDVLSVVAQEVAITIRCSDGIRPVRVLSSNAEINGQNVVVGLNQVYSMEEKYVILEVEVPATKSEFPRKIARVEVSYANMKTRTTDRLSSEVSVKFSSETASIDKAINVKVMEQCVLQLANIRNTLATELRDKGDIAGARKLLLDNGTYLKAFADKYNSELLRLRSNLNTDQAGNLDGVKWKYYRKQMRRFQFHDNVQSNF